MRLWLEGSMVDHGLSREWVKPSFAMAATGSPQVLPPSVEALRAMATKGLELASSKSKIWL